jgi:hypothetical protein
VRAIAWKAQQRLHSRYRILTARRKKAVIVVTALARELCGFVWAIACQLHAPEKLQNRTAPAEGQAPSGSGKRPYVLDLKKKFKK